MKRLDYLLSGLRRIWPAFGDQVHMFLRMHIESKMHTLRACAGQHSYEMHDDLG